MTILNATAGTRTTGHWSKPANCALNALPSTLEEKHKTNHSPPLNFAQRDGTAALLCNFLCQVLSIGGIEQNAILAQRERDASGLQVAGDPEVLP